MWTFFSSQFDAISPVHFEGEGLGLSLRTGGGDLITGGDSAGEVFSEYTPLGAFNLVNSLTFPSAREVHTLLHLLRCW